VRNRSSLRIVNGGAVLVASAVLGLGLGVGCGGGAAAPTPTATSSTSVPAVPAPSPPRPAFTSPVPSPSVSGATVSPTATQVAAGETYEVQSGDTLLSIAEQYYGDGTQWRRIYDANKDVIGADPDKLKIGMQLKIPPKST
jgi:5'-nucleotidase